MNLREITEKTMIIEKLARLLPEDQREAFLKLAKAELENFVKMEEIINTEKANDDE